jgi:hypothetical protein
MDNTHVAQRYNLRDIFMTATAKSFSRKKKVNMIWTEHTKPYVVVVQKKASSGPYVDAGAGVM